MIYIAKCIAYGVGKCITFGIENILQLVLKSPLLDHSSSNLNN